MYRLVDRLLDALTYSTQASLILTASQWSKMLHHVEECTPAEGCGLVVGRGNCVSEIYPITNTLKSSFRYCMDPHELLKIYLYIDQLEQELLAIYHSHPRGPAIPSKIDLTENYYPGVLQLIWYRVEQEWNCRAYHFQGDTAIEVPISIHNE